MPIEGLDHINIVTPRLETTRAFLVEILGLREGGRPHFEATGYWLYAGDRPLIHIQEARIPVGSSHVCALNHVAFRVTDFDELVARLRAREVPVDVRTVPGTTVRQAFFDDPNGVRLEIGETPEAGPPRPVNNDWTG